MLSSLTQNLELQERTLVLRAQRQQVLAANIANADTPGFQARDFDFAAALGRAAGTLNGVRTPLAMAIGKAGALSTGMPQTVLAAPAHRLADASHLPLSVSTTGHGVPLAYRLPEQPSLDGNTVDLDRERAGFADNSVRYEATLRFIDSGVRTMLSAIRGD